MARAIEEQPLMNSRFDDDAGIIHQFGGIHMGIAAQTDAGLIVPVVRHVETLNLRACGAEMRHVVRTRAYVTSLADHGPGFVRAHGEVFRGIDPVTCGIECGLNQPGMVVEIEADAVILNRGGGLAL